MSYFPFFFFDKKEEALFGHIFSDYLFLGESDIHDSCS